MSVLRPLQRIPVVLGKVRMVRYIRISVANVSRNAITLTIRLAHQTRAYPDTGESGQTYELEQLSANTNV